jgi:hypothetical protein
MPKRREQKRVREQRETQPIPYHTYTIERLLFLQLPLHTTLTYVCYNLTLQNPKSFMSHRENPFDASFSLLSQSRRIPQPPPPPAILGYLHEGREHDASLGNKRPPVKWILCKLTTNLCYIVRTVGTCELLRDGAC